MFFLPCLFINLESAEDIAMSQINAFGQVFKESQPGPRFCQCLCVS